MSKDTGVFNITERIDEARKQANMGRWKLAIWYLADVAEVLSVGGSGEASVDARAGTPHQAMVREQEAGQSEPSAQGARRKGLAEKFKEMERRPVPYEGLSALGGDADAVQADPECAPGDATKPPSDVGGGEWTAGYDINTGNHYVILSNGTQHRTRGKIEAHAIADARNADVQRAYEAGLGKHADLLDEALAETQRETEAADYWARECQKLREQEPGASDEVPASGGKEKSAAVTPEPGRVPGDIPGKWLIRHDDELGGYVVGAWMQPDTVTRTEELANRIVLLPILEAVAEAVTEYRQVRMFQSGEVARKAWGRVALALDALKETRDG